MDFKEAVECHVGWKIKLRTYSNNPDKSLDPAVVEVDNKCTLGQWIYGEGKKFSTLPQYATLKEYHAKFHKCAGDIIRKIDAGQKTAAVAELNSGEYVKISNMVIQQIGALKLKAGV